MIFIPKTVRVIGDTGPLDVNFDLIDDGAQVLIKDVVVVSVINYGLPNFLFLDESSGDPHLYTKRISLKDNGTQEIVREYIATTILTRQLIKVLCRERDLYVSEKYSAR